MYLENNQLMFKTMVDNFDEISKFLEFDQVSEGKNIDKPDVYYLIQIIKRRKENPDMLTGNKLKESFYLYKKEDLNKLKEKIIFLCKHYNARAYIRINRRSLEETAFETLRKVTDLICNKDYKNVQNAYLSAAGKTKFSKFWILDIDTPETLPEVLKFISESKNLALESDDPKVINAEICIHLKLKTVNGYHIIVNRFNCEYYKKKFTKDGLIHKDSPTVLYYSNPE